MHQRKKIYMDRFIVLCDHDLLWDIKLEEEFNSENICISYADDIDDICNVFPDTNIDIIICSAMEFFSFTEYGYIIKKGISVFVVADEYSEADEFNALKAGCFDYQLRTAPIKVIAQRIKNRLAETSHKKKLYFDSAAGSIYPDRELASLTKRESAVLKVLLSNEGIPIEKKIILQKVWGENFKGNIRVIDTVIKQLRKKLSGYNIKIITHYGRGVSASCQNW